MKRMHEIIEQIKKQFDELLWTMPELDGVITDSEPYYELEESENMSEVCEWLDDYACRLDVVMNELIKAKRFLENWSDKLAEEEKHGKIDD